ncbi:MAG: DNA polymerase I [Melioribacteraceae bacterium]|nr:DNA polymerase I [Melioribacteraceae bacterium]MCF8264581.1 DNA polymerase I [Melioribacteraceae bacterium]MCF8412324.1 DNA polymerase I [Melioribacteraceae bacterium]
MKKKVFVLIDAMALAYKGYFAFINRPLSNSKDEPTSAVFGFLNQLFKIIEDTKPDYIAVAFDSKEKTFRHERYDKYKSSRAQMPDDLIPQIQRIKDIIEAFKMPLYIKPGFEADDLIGTAAKIGEKEGFLTYAVTPDKDYVQMVTENVRLVKPGKSTDEIQIVDLQKVKDDYGFNPEQMIDFLALVGDSSDDIPGVAGIGPKSATPLIQEFGSVESIYDNIEKIEKKGIKNKLIENKENAFLSKELATIKTDVEFEIDIEQAKFGDPDTELLVKIFTDLEFKNFPEKVKKLFDRTLNVEEIVSEMKENDVFDKNSVSYKLIQNKEDAATLASELSKQEVFVFDTETDSLDTLSVNLAGASFCFEKGKAFFVATNPFTENRDGLFSRDLSDRITIEEFIEIFSPVFTNPKIKKVCQNGKYDIGVLKKYGIDVKNFHFDTMLASYVLDPDQKHGMDELSKKHLNYSPISITEIIGTKKDATNIFDSDPTELSNYAAEDADITFRLYKKLKRDLEESGMDKLAYEVEFPLVEVLEEVERNGILVDKRSLKELSNYLSDLLVNYTKQIFEASGEEFNINSTKQLQTILFEKLELPKTKKTKTGFSTDARSLESLKGKHEIIDNLLNYRQVSKLKSTYADSLPKLINPVTGKIHTTFNQTVASTGRLSSNDPNLQNIPIRSELGKEIRKAFVASDSNHLILSADYSQIELRIMAHICGDEGMKKAFKDGEDIHRSTAALVFMVDPEDVTPDMRRKAKEVNFGILYGIGAFGLKTRLGILQSHAQEIIDTYFKTFNRVKSYMDESVKQAREKGYAETLLGRRRYLTNINSNNRVVRQFEERVAINMPIQGSAADMIKLAMINIHRELKQNNWKSKMVLQVHDELLFDAEKSEIDSLRIKVKELMENSLPLEVPILVETGVGKNWLEAH